MRWAGLLDRDFVTLEFEGGVVPRRVHCRARRRGDRAHARLDDDPVVARRYARL